MSDTRTTAERFCALRDELLDAAAKQKAGDGAYLARYAQAAAACQLALVSAVEHCDCGGRWGSIEIDGYSTCGHCRAKRQP